MPSRADRFGHGLGDRAQRRHPIAVAQSALAEVVGVRPGRAEQHGIVSVAADDGDAQ